MVSYIITHKVSHEDRNINLKFILEWINELPFVGEVILVEQGGESKVFDLSSLKTNYHLEYHFLYNPGDFNKSWAYNYGAKIAKNDWIGFGDNDVFMSPQILIDAYNDSLEIGSFTPYNIVRDFNSNMSKNIRNDREYDIEAMENPIRGGAPYGGGIFFIKKAILFDIGAWDEGFLNWGAEDEDITSRIKSGSSWREHINTAYHLWHDRDVNSTQGHKHYKNNYKLMIENKAKLFKSKKVVELNEIGLPDKYINDNEE